MKTAELGENALVSCIIDFDDIQLFSETARMFRRSILSKQVQLLVILLFYLPADILLNSVLRGSRQESLWLILSCPPICEAQLSALSLLLSFERFACHLSLKGHRHFASAPYPC